MVPTARIPALWSYLNEYCDARLFEKSLSPPIMIKRTQRIIVLKEYSCARSVLSRMLCVFLGMLTAYVCLGCMRHPTELFECIPTTRPSTSDSSGRTRRLKPVYHRYNRPRIFCYLNTFPKNYESKALHVHYTWARRCTNNVFTSTQDHPRLPMLKLNLTQPETRLHLWSKMRSILREVYKHVDQYDYFFKADDDTYVVYENLQKTLQSQSPDLPFMTGYLWKALVKCGYFSGGAGYVLSREALRRIVEQAIDKHPDCPVVDEDKEDVKMSSCGQAVGVKLIQAIGPDGRSVFYPYRVRSHAKDVLKDEKLMSNSTSNSWHVSFHYENSSSMYIMEFLLYYVRPEGLE
ncbi:unnamed protein product [Calicophoron daubneyi]|uniref:N-acetylgalactosaminide beta-1,3-galactosyltransferase n=1 Tax=Calicophoron daubneyi TaxID=300641 RepID=A0AAV2TSV3_CALDB